MAVISEMSTHSYILSLQIAAGPNTCWFSGLYVVESQGRVCVFFGWEGGLDERFVGAVASFLVLTLLKSSPVIQHRRTGL